MELGESMEDYLEATYLLKRKHGYVRNTMLCRYMNYTKASISVAMKLLAERGYVVRDQKGCIDLTEKGEKAATEVYARHLLLKERKKMPAEWSMSSVTNLSDGFSGWCMI